MNLIIRNIKTILKKLYRNTEQIFLDSKQRMKNYIIAHFNSKIKYRKYRFSTNETKNIKPIDINAKLIDINIKPEDIQK